MINKFPALSQEMQALCDRIDHTISAEEIVKRMIDHIEGGDKEVRIMIEFAEKIAIDALQNIPSIMNISEIGDKKIMISSSLDIRSDISKLALEKGWLIVGMSKEEISLENIFQNVTQK